MDRQAESVDHEAGARHDAQEAAAEQVELTVGRDRPERLGLEQRDEGRVVDVEQVGLPAELDRRWRPDRGSRRTGMQTLTGARPPDAVAAAMLRALRLGRSVLT